MSAARPLIYLAAPYSSNNRLTPLIRVGLATRAAAYLRAAGYEVFNPIGHGHSICQYAVRYGLIVDTDCAAWQGVNNAMIRASSGLVVLMLDGWQESVGIKKELALARKLGIPVTYLTLDEITRGPVDIELKAKAA